MVTWFHPHAPKSATIHLVRVGVALALVGVALVGVRVALVGVLHQQDFPHPALIFATTLKH